MVYYVGKVFGLARIGTAIGGCALTCGKNVTLVMMVSAAYCAELAE